MRHILIIFSIFLLTSPLFGYPSGEQTVFYLEFFSGNMCKGFEDKVTQNQYNGDVQKRNRIVKEL